MALHALPTQLDGLDNPQLSTEELLVKQGILSDTTLNLEIEAAQKLVNLLLQKQCEVYEKISESVGKSTF
jgi:hypothetical protein